MIDLGEDIGRTTVRIGHSEVNIDVWETSNRLVNLRDASMSDGGELDVMAFHARVVEHLRSLGFPECSHMLADRFVGAIHQTANEMMASLKKKASPTESPESPDSTGSPPSG